MHDNITRQIKEVFSNKYPEVLDDEKLILDDISQHIEFLHQALQTESLVIFTEYTLWVQSVLNAKGVETETIIKLYETMRPVLASEHVKATAFINESINKLKQKQPSEGNIDSYLKTEESKKYLALLLKGDRKEATDFIMSLADNDMPIKEIYLNIFQSSQYEMGRLWEKNKVSVAQEHYCTATTQMIMSMLYPRLFSSNAINKSVVATCVGSELHEIGIRMISDFMEMDGWDTYYLGANTPSEAVIDAISKYNANLLALSVTLTPHVKNAESIIKDVKRAHPHLKILVGGYPFLMDSMLWKKIGADGLAESANEVNEIARALING